MDSSIPTIRFWNLFGLAPTCANIPNRVTQLRVLGSEPEIYFYSHRHSATGYIYTYGLMEPQKYAQQMQQEMIREIEGARPKYLISVAMGYSWLRRPDSEPAIFTWANEYMAQNYHGSRFREH